MATTESIEREAVAATAPNGDWQHRLDVIVETMREMSLQTDPQAMVRAYGTADPPVHAGRPLHRR